jgi:hypothetical protein
MTEGAGVLNVQAISQAELKSKNSKKTFYNLGNSRVSVRKW